MLIDSNIIIYAAQTGYDDLRRFIAQHAPAVSAVSYEVDNASARCTSSAVIHPGRWSRSSR